MYFSQNLFECSQKYTYINPKLGCGVKQILNKANPIDLKNKLKTFIAQEKDAGRTDEVAVYYRDLLDGPILGIDENKEFIPASLLKLPLAMTFYRLVEEEQPNIMTKKLRYIDDLKEKEELVQFFKPTKIAQPGISYTIQELIYYTIVYSDNMAYNVLVSALKSIMPDRNLVLETYRDLGLTSSTSIVQADISARLYATIFRILYNASYLTVEHSENILSMLAESAFNEGIAAGVPKDIKVANQFGERFVGQKKQLHDCGIIYYPDNAYLLCVMTYGDDFPELVNVISQISTMVYEDVDTKRLK